MKIFLHLDNVSEKVKIEDKKKFIDETQREFDLVVQANIPAVVKYYEFKPEAIWHKKNGQDVECSYLLMENLEGLMLVSFFNKVPRQLRNNDNDLRFIYLQIADAINKLHTAGIAHRDIKPENIMIQ